MVDGDETLSAVEHTSTPPSAGQPDGAGEMPPAMLVDRYHIERRLGAGGMGVVYAARDIHLGRIVAVKLVSPRIDAGSGQERLVREAQAMAKLRHPNIATIYDIGVSDDRVFVVMELIEGGTVVDWLKARPRSWRAIVDVYLQAGRGLATAHAAGFVHRDFKPENVLIGTDGVARVSDFGVVRILGETDAVLAGESVADDATITRSGVVVGTPGYIAPEILRHEPADARADQFSFCVALIASLFGERPFPRLEGRERALETLGVLRSPPAGIVPRWLLRSITRGLQGSPRDRWPTMAALVAAIERRLGRRRLALVGSVVAIAAVAATSIVIARRSTPAPPPDWSPVVMGRTGADALRAMVVSADGSTLASISETDAWVGPRVGAGARQHVVLPSDQQGLFRLSRTGNRLFCSVQGVQTAVIWALDVATGRAERRVPTAAAPAILRGGPFDVGPEEQILFLGLDKRTVWRADRAGAVRHVRTVAPGQWIDEAVWSPDGTRTALNIDSPGEKRIEIVSLANHGVAVVSHRRCDTIAWLTDHSLVCAPLQYRRPSMIELLLPTDGGEATERFRYNGPEFTQLAELATSSAGVLFATSPFEFHLAILDLDAPGAVRPIGSGGVSDLPLAGWTSSGSLIFGTSVQGQLRIMRRLPDGTIETLRRGPAAEVPLVVLGETIIFGRFPGGEATIPFVEPPYGRKFPDGELFRLAPDGALTPLGVTRGFRGIMCAAGRAPPCLLEEYSGNDVVAIDWDAESGARGRERARWNVKSYSAFGALSPDGRTVAQVQRYRDTGAMSLLDLESGRRQTLDYPQTSLHFASWLPDGSLLAVGSKDGDTDLLRVRDPETVEVVAVVAPRNTSSFAADVHIAYDGKTAAFLMTGAETTYWWAETSQE